MTRQDALTLFGLMEGCSDTDIKHAYRSLTKIYFPDVPETGDAEMFKKIKKAYDILLKSTPESTSILLTHQSIFKVVKK